MRYCPIVHQPEKKRLRHYSTQAPAASTLRTTRTTWTITMRGCLKTSCTEKKTREPERSQMSEEIVNWCDQRGIEVVDTPGM